MAEYKILEQGKDDKVLVEWNRSWGKEYSVHTQTDNGLIWGHYYTNREDAEEYFAQYKR